MPRIVETVVYAIGVPMPFVSRPVGHSNLRMTLRYTHLADLDTKAADERVGTAMAQLLAEGRF